MLRYQMAKAYMLTNTASESRQVKKFRDLKKTTSAPGRCVQKAWKETLGGLPSLPMTRRSFW